MVKAELSAQELQESRVYGGSDIPQWRDYEEVEEANYAEDPNHIERSVSHSPQHQRHFGLTKPFTSDVPPIQLTERPDSKIGSRLSRQWYNSHTPVTRSRNNP